MSLRNALARVNDSRSPAHGILSAALVAGLTLIEPRSLSVGRRLAYRGAVAAVTAWTVWAGLRSNDQGTFSSASRAAIAAGAGGAALGFAEAGEALDGRLRDGLVRAGVSRPRLVLAAAGAVLSIGSWWADRRSVASADVEATFDDSPETLTEVPEEIRTLTARLLEATDSFGAPELRAQLAEARLIHDGDDGFWSAAQLDVPEHLPRAVPGNATFPVVGRFHALDDRSFDVRIIIENGALASVFVEEGDDWTSERLEAWHDADRGVHELGAWPAADTLELLTETPGGRQPIR